VPRRATPARDRDPSTCRRRWRSMTCSQRAAAAVRARSSPTPPACPRAEPLDSTESRADGIALHARETTVAARTSWRVATA
jgi:hypothetical protein